jgi:shikimate kinase
MIHPITLVGFRASGKTTVARLIARILDWPWVDADAEVERRSGQRIPDLFQSQGEAGFRDWEERVLADLLCEGGERVIATGGGVVVRETNRQRLSESTGLVVYLQAEAPVLADRLRRNLGGRPSLTGKDPADEVQELLAIRDPWYRETADLIIDAVDPADLLAARIVGVASAPQ